MQIKLTKLNIQINYYYEAIWHLVGWNGSGDHRNARKAIS